MDRKIKIFCKNNQEYINVREGSNLRDILKAADLQNPWPVLAAKVNHVPSGLGMRIFTAKDIEFIDYRDAAGKRCYVHSLCFLLYVAIKHLYPEGRLQFMHAISRGFFCKVEIGHEIEQEDIEAITKEMQSLVEKDLKFQRLEAHTQEVADMFHQSGLLAKAKLLEASSLIYSTYYQLDDVIDCYYDFLVPSTRYLNLFKIEKYKTGLLLRVPTREDPARLEEMINQDQMFEAFKENRQWNDTTKLRTIGDLYEVIRQGYLSQLINVTEALQEKKIVRIADEITSREDVKVILISGPSSSGKTTFSKRLSVQLMANAKSPVTISMDDYFVNRVETPLDEHGEYDFECLHALDLELFNRDLSALLRGEEIQLPHYNFTTGQREYLGNTLKLEDNTILIMEGNHALNPELSASIPREKKYMIYVSALTSVAVDDHNRISTTDNRLLRRIVRDFNYRGFSAQDTIKRCPSVSRGEERWIFPFQENADVMFNSSLIYELSALKPHVEPLLRSVPRDAEEFGEALRLLRFIDYVPNIQDKDIPLTSLLREFLGGSSFRY